MAPPPIATKTKPAVLIIGGTVLALVLLWIFAYTPALAKKSDAEAGLQAATENNQSLSIQVAHLKNAAKDKALLSAQVAEFVRQFPSSADQAGTFKAIQDAAKSAGVTVNSFSATAPVQATVVAAPTGASALATARPGLTVAPAPVATAPTAPAAPGAVGAPNFPIAEVDVSIAVTGDMNEVTKFISAVENMDRPVLVNGVTLAGADASQAGTASVKTSTNLTLRVFIAKPLDNPATSATVATTAVVVPTP